ncbi:MAG: zinc ABC transporter substrate-binding protein [Gammaproteobacteria bacterium]|nr:zinc ABC transporter substrate-binding protein [Gammaproteobacteria bacterium]
MISRFHLLFTLLLVPAITNSTPRVITSIAPLHAITSAIMQDIDQAELLINDASSPHGFRLQPSSALKIQHADLVIWIGPDLESKLADPLQQLIEKNKLLTVLELPLPTILHNRRPGLWSEHDHDHRHAKDAIDPHVWLDIDNARAIADAISARLSEIDPQHAAAYRNNNEKLQVQLQQTDQQIKTLLKPAQSKKFVILHDALQYFEHHYALQSMGALTIDSHKAGSAQRLAGLKQAMNKQNVSCVLYEQMPDRTIIDVLLEDSNAHAAVIDPLGMSLANEERTYSDLILKLANAVRGCLSDQ